MSLDFLVNFLIVGTQKGGTTALAHFLSTHPQICMSPHKEVHFFDYPQSDLNIYSSFFPNYTNQIAIGEATPIYIYFPWIAPLLKAYNPNLKLILILRSPIERAFSQYQMERARSWESLNFSWAIRLESMRLIWARWGDPLAKEERSPLRINSYCDRGFYSKQIENLLKYFPRQNLLILRSEELKSHHEQVLIQVYDFLGVDLNIAIPPQAQLLVGNYQNSMSETDFRWLSSKFHHEIDRLEKLLDWDLDSWRKYSG
jgi:Sulfotransferase domain